MGKILTASNLCKVIQSLQSKITFTKTLCLKRKKKRKLCGGRASAGMAACGERILENHGRNQWFKMSSCQFDHAGLSMSWFWGQIVSWQTAIQQNGITKL